MTSIRGLTKPPVPEVTLEEQLEYVDVDQHRPLKVLLAIDGSPTSLAAVGELAGCHLPRGSSITVLTVLHTAVHAIPDCPPWSVSILATHADTSSGRPRPSTQVVDRKRFRRTRNRLDRESTVRERPMTLATWLAIQVLRVLPRTRLSHAVGRLCGRPLPSRISRVVERAHVRLYGVDMTDVAPRQGAYPTIGAFFTRPLRPGARAVSQARVVSPEVTNATKAAANTA